jgi:adenosine deaminase
MPAPEELPRDLALADLHRHLDGSLRPATLRALAAQRAVPVPPDLLFFPEMGLEAALARFAFTLSLLQSPAAVRRVAAEICEDAHAEGVTTLEIRFAPQLHRGADVATIIDAALAGIAGRAGLVLCGLYGEPPEVLEELVDAARTRPGVVGIDLAGGPAPAHRFGLRDYAPPFRRARDVGLGRTVHAAEGRPADEIRVAVELLHAQRIGHGTTLLDAPALPGLLRERGVCIEACPTSNWHTGVIPAIAAHPLPRWLDLGVAVTVAPDNTLLSDVGARGEYTRVLAMPGMSLERVAALAACGHAAAFRRGSAPTSPAP